MESTAVRGLSAAEFFARGFKGGTMTAAHHATGIAYSTIFRAKEGGPVGRKTAKALAAWSKTVADTEGAVISAARTLGLDGDDEGDDEIEAEVESRGQAERPSHAPGVL